MTPLSDLPENGSHVSWRELILALKPIHLTLADNGKLLESLSKKVDAVLADGIAHRARVDAKLARSRSIRFWATITASLSSGAIVTAVLIITGHL